MYNIIKALVSVATSTAKLTGLTYFMGLTISHGVFNAPYSRFMAWRTELAKIAGFPPLGFMEGFYSDGYSNPFEYWKIFLRDEVALRSIKDMQDQLPIPCSHKAITIKFIEGLENAIVQKKRIVFR